MRTITEITADMVNHVREVAPETVSYCLQSCIMCSGECQAWCGMQGLETELLKAICKEAKDV